MNIIFIKKCFLFLIFLKALDCQVPAGIPTTNYNQDIAKRMLRLSAAAYGTNITSCIKETFHMDEDNFIFNNQSTPCDFGKNTCFYYSIINDKTKEITIIFRGTKTTRQLLREGFDSLHHGVDFFGLGIVNFYFNRAHNILWTSIYKLFENDKYDGYKVYVTGHSLGGALAALCAARIRKENYRNSSDIFLYTFGEPRVGTSDFAFNFDMLVPNSWRVIHGMDVVPHLPPCKKRSSYSLLQILMRRESDECDPSAVNEPYHHGTEIWYPNGMSENDTFVECTGYPKNEDANCSNQYLYKISQFKEYVDDHVRYFNHKVSAFGKLGCKPGLEELEEVLSNEPVEAM